jgi:hypothetical protein
MYQIVEGGLEKKAGFIFDTVVDFNDKVIEGMKAFRGFDGGYAMAGDIGVIPMGQRDVEMRKSAMCNDPRDGGYGFFWMEKLGRMIATLPMKVLYTGTNGINCSHFMKVASLAPDGGIYDVYPSEIYTGLTVMDDGSVYMGPEWNWAGINGIVKVAETDSANKIEWPVDYLEIRSKSGRFYLQNMDEPSISKEGETATSFFDKASRIFSDSGQLIELMKIAEDKGSAFCSYVKQETARRSEPLQWIPKPVNLTKEAAFIRPTGRKFEFFKYAFEVGEEDATRTVDSTLGLNFINDENIHQFLEHVDSLEDAKQVIAKLLLASRLGLDIEQSPLRTALFSIDDITRQLRQLKGINQGSEMQ